MPPRSPSLRATLIAATAAALAMGAAPAEKPTTASPAASVAPDSPRAAITDFLSLVEQGKEDEAAKYLDTPSGDPTLTALQLAAVLEGQPRFELEQASPASTGFTDDELPEDEDVVALIELGQATPEQVKMRARAAAPRWRFTANTTARVPAWYERTPNAWAAKTLPHWLVQRGPAGVRCWQWFALLGLAALGWGLGTLTGRTLSRFVSKLVSRSKTTWDDLILAKLQGPLAFGLGVTIVGVVVPFLGLPESTGSFIGRVIKGLFLGVFFWILLRAVDVAREVLVATLLRRDQPNSRSLISLGARFIKAVLFAILVIAVLSLLGVPVGSLLAGLGIGGLAVALAGQKTLENLIGTFAIGFDHPFREGDFVKVRDFMGTVETIGLRSTRFRTLDRTIITLPNGKLADEQIETFAPRDRFRLAFTLGIRYGATPQSLNAAISKVQELVEQEPKIDASSATVRLVSLGEMGMGIEVIAMLNTADGSEFGLARQSILLKTLEALGQLGVTLDPASVFHATSPQAATALKNLQKV